MQSYALVQGEESRRNVMLYTPSQDQSALAAFPQHETGKIKADEVDKEKGITAYELDTKSNAGNCFPDLYEDVEEKIVLSNVVLIFLKQLRLNQGNDTAGKGLSVEDLQTLRRLNTKLVISF